MAKQDSLYIEYLKHDIEEKYGRSFKSPTDFDTLESLIADCSGTRLSSSTLKRLWGYVSTNSKPRLSTLTIVARVLGFIDWDEYVEKLMRASRVESDFISTSSINVEKLEPGDMVTLQWNPDRTLTLTSLGDSRFRVVEQKNSKLKIGDTFKTLFLREGSPLYCTSLQREGVETPLEYVAGKSNGIYNLRCYPAKEK